MLRKWGWVGGLLCGLCAPVLAQDLKCDHRIAPVYPEKARQAGVESEVSVVFRMDAMGHYKGLVSIAFDRPLPDEYWDAFHSAIVTALAQYQCPPNMTLLERFGFKLQ